MAHPNLIVAAEGPSFDGKTLQNWRDEGFDVSYVPFNTSRKQYVERFNQISNSLKMDDKYAIVGLLTLGRVLWLAQV